MIINNSINFDNTKSVKHFAESAEAQHILNNSFYGSETQLYKIGQKVSSTLHGYNNGIITDCYNSNGFWQYEVEHGKRKKYISRERQCDIILLEV